MRRVPIQAMKMPKAWPVLASALNAELGWWEMLSRVRYSLSCTCFSAIANFYLPGVSRLGLSYGQYCAKTCLVWPEPDSVTNNSAVFTPLWLVVKMRLILTTLPFLRVIIRCLSNSIFSGAKTGGELYRSLTKQRADSGPPMFNEYQLVNSLQSVHTRVSEASSYVEGLSGARDSVDTAHPASQTVAINRRSARIFLWPNTQVRGTVARSAEGKNSLLFLSP